MDAIPKSMQLAANIVGLNRCVYWEYFYGKEHLECGAVMFLSGLC